MLIPASGRNGCVTRGRNVCMACGRIYVSLLPVFGILRRLAMYPMRRRICPQSRGHEAYIGPRADVSHLGKVGQCLGFCAAQRFDMLFSTGKFNTSTESVAMLNHGA